MNLRDKLVGELQTAPIPFEEFMQRALYSPDHGYFATGRIRSDKDGDFLTSPEVSAMFGETIARFIEEERDRSGSEQFGIVELGAGTGSLLAPALSGIGFEPEPLIAVEVSAAARTSLETAVPGADVRSSVDDIGPFKGVIIANELVDNLPMALAVRAGDDWRERWVGSDGVDVVWVDAPVRPEIEQWLGRWAGPVPDGGLVEVQLQAQSLVLTTFAKLLGGAMVLIDYGDTAAGLAGRRGDGTLRTYQGHHLGPDPLHAPGETDITADVNFSALVDVLVEVGAEVELISQADFLNRFDLSERLVEMRTQELTAARQGEVMAQLQGRTMRTAGETLLHPRGLGDFRVLIARV